MEDSFKINSRRMRGMGSGSGSLSGPPSRTLTRNSNDKDTIICSRYFKPFTSNSLGVTRSLCDLCDKVIETPGKGSGTSMRRHIAREHPALFQTLFPVKVGQKKKKEVVSFIIGEEENEATFKVPSAPKSSTSSTLILTSNNGNNPVRILRKPEDLFPPERNGRSISRPEPSPAQQMEVFVPEATDNESDFEETDTDILQGLIPSTSTSSTGFGLDLGQFGQGTCALTGPGPSFGQDGQRICKYDQVLRSIVTYLASNLQPLSSVDSTEFKALLLSIDESFITNLLALNFHSLLRPVKISLAQIYSELKTCVCHQLSGKFLSISIDFWIKPYSNYSEVYLMARANYIQDGDFDFNLILSFLGIRKLTQNSHNCLQSEEIVTIITQLLNEYQIVPEKVTRLVINSADFEETPDLSQLKIPIWPCLNEILRRSSFLVNKFFKKVTGKDFHSLLKKFGKLILPDYDHVKCSPFTLVEALMTKIASDPDKDKLEPELYKLIPETYLKAYQKYQVPFLELLGLLLEDNQSVIPASKIILVICQILHHFQAEELTDDDDSFQKILTIEQKRSLTEQLANYIEHSYKIDLTSSEWDIGTDLTLPLCSYLDPRHRDSIILSEEQTELICDKMQALLIQICGANGNEEDPAGVKEELNNYFDEPISPLTSDPFEWWRENSGKYPTVSELARRNLSILGQVSPAKFVFGKEATTYMNGLSQVEPEYLEMLLFIRNNKFN